MSTYYQKIPYQQKPQVFFVLGGPGSGKGTQSKLIGQTFGFHHMSAGDLLRKQRENKKSENGQLIQQYMVEGKIVPCQITVKLLDQEMKEKGYRNGHFLIDGFPRNRQNLQKWNMYTHPEILVPFIIVLQCGESCMMQRLLNRGKTSGRIDDNVDVIKRRFQTYNEETKSVIQYFKQKNKVIVVNAQGNVEQTFKEVSKKIKQRLGLK